MSVLFFLDILFYYQVDLLLNSFYKIDINSIKKINVIIDITNVNYVNFIFSRYSILLSIILQLLQFSNLSFLFMTNYFVPFAFLSSLPTSIK